ncbi:type IV pilin protein [Cyanobium sp. CH-040]|uniref:type IV pilin protein n=1 Tax=Cyanobium sp. CH-040 TaxID=2823708 RepID=UPI0020CECEFE|nr:prepilin-type N-terminal cleavage/methylation domain-containing protein [Cyanobium sp. CH-040]MCP9926359.1 prepilin-type N-terminal cleavage/methylation domain-containing protein [Cyanobium sp. CH-040]
MLHLLNKRNRLQAATSNGFTLIELLVVIVILGVLGAVGYQAYINQIGRANEAVAQTAATALAKACAANLVVPEADFSIDDIVDGDRVALTDGANSTCVAAADGTVTPATFTVVAGSGGSQPATRSATVQANGAVVIGDGT